MFIGAELNGSILYLFSMYLGLYSIPPRKKLSNKILSWTCKFNYIKQNTYTYICNRFIYKYVCYYCFYINDCIYCNCSKVQAMFIGKVIEDIFYSPYFFVYFFYHKYITNFVFRIKAWSYWKQITYTKVVYFLLFQFGESKMRQNLLSFFWLQKLFI